MSKKLVTVVLLITLALILLNLLRERNDVVIVESQSHAKISEVSELYKVLSQFENKDIPIKVIQVNFAFIPVALNLICSMNKVGIDDRILIWAMDDITSHTFQGYGYAVYFDPNLPGSIVGEVYHSKEYNRLMRARMDVYRRIVSNGFKFWFLDADVVIRKNIDDFEGTASALLVQTNNQGASGPTPTHIPPACAGIFFMNNNQAAIDLVSTWAKKAEQSESNEDQQMLQEIINSPLVQVKNGPPTNGPISVEFLSREDFPTGHIFRSSKNPMSIIKNAYAVHFNAYSVTEKLPALKSMGLFYLNELGICK